MSFAAVIAALRAEKTRRFGVDARLMFRGKPVRVVGRMRLEGASGQTSFRYQFSDGAGAPVIAEEAEGRFTLLRPFPAGAAPDTAGSTVTVGKERYSLVGIRRLKIREMLGQTPGGGGKAPLLLSGMFEGPAGTLMREVAPGSSKQVYYLVKAIAPGDLLTEEEYAERKAEARRAAGAREDD